MRLLVATTNQDKLREIRRLLADSPAEVIGLRDFGDIPEPEETGATFADNARLKASCYAQAVAAEFDGYSVAEDSGLVIDALGGEPGVHSARFLRPDASYPERFAEIYRRMAAVPAAPRTARFVCALAVVRNGVVVFETMGTVEGEIADTPRGTGGFGYDPIFYYPAYGRTLAEVPEQEKLVVAHRGQAFRRLARWLETETATEADQRM